MKTPPVSFVAIAVSLAASSAEGQFLDYPAADRVLGASDFISWGPQTSGPSSIDEPSGLVIAQTTGKLFVSANKQHRILSFADVTSLSNTADANGVYGQTGFLSVVPGTTDKSLRNPYGLSIDQLGRLWVADSLNNRVLMYANAATVEEFGATADLVLGQPNFVTSTPGAAASKMDSPQGVFVDASDNLWVADSGNNRVLKFANVSSLSIGAMADVALGQPDFSTVTAATSAEKMSSPIGVAVDGDGYLWVSDHSNRRVLRFDNAASLETGAAASGVLGQPDFNSNAYIGTTANSMIFPSAILIDSAGTLYVADYLNNRVLLYKNASEKSNGAAADNVIGQPNFTSDTADTTDRKLRSPYGGMALDPAGRLWLTDSGNRRVLRFPTLMTESALDSALSADLGNDLNGNSEVDVGDEISYVLTLTNPDDESNAAVPSVRFLLIPPRESGLVIGSVTTSQGTIAVGNSNGDDSIDVRIGTIADSETVTITFTLKLGFEAVSPLRVQGTISSDLPGDLLSDDPALSGEDNPTEFAVNFAYRPATLTVIQVKPVKRPAATLRGLATNAVSVELKRKLSGPTHVFEVVGSSWRARLTGLRTGPNHFTVRALGKDGSYTAPLIITVRRLAHPRWR